MFFSQEFSTHLSLSFLNFQYKCPELPNNKEVKLIGKKVCGKKRKSAQKKKLIDSLCESNINTVAEENVSSDNIQFSPEKDLRKRKMNSSKRKMDLSLFFVIFTQQYHSDSSTRNFFISLKMLIMQ